MEVPWPRGREGERERMGSVEEEDECNMSILGKIITEKSNGVDASDIKDYNFNFVVACKGDITLQR